MSSATAVQDWYVETADMSDVKKNVQMQSATISANLHTPSEPSCNVSKPEATNVQRLEPINAIISRKVKR